MKSRYLLSLLVQFRVLYDAREPFVPLKGDLLQSSHVCFLALQEQSDSEQQAL